MPGILHANSRPFDDGESFSRRRSGNKQRFAEQVVAIQSLVDFERSAKQAGALGPPLNVLNRFQCPEQYGGSLAFGLGHDIHAIVHAINEINVGVAGRAEHRSGPGGESFGRVRGEIMRAQVGFHLDDPADSLEPFDSVNQIFTEQFSGHQRGIPGIKASVKFPHGCIITIFAPNAQAWLFAAGSRSV